MDRLPTSHVDDAKSVGKRLRDARAKASLSQRALSFQGCTAAYISRIEAGERVPSLQMINELATRLDVTPQWLATGVDRPEPETDEIVDAEVALRLGATDEARTLYEARLRPGDPARPAALAGLGQIALRDEQVTEAVDLLERAFAARKENALADPSAVEALGRAYAATGDLESAISLFERALRQAREVEAQVEELRFAVLLANCLIDHGTYGEAETTLAESIKLAQSGSDPLAEARVFWSQSRLHVLRGEAPLAARYARRALEILRRTEHDSYVAMAYHLLAFAEIESGNADEALELLDQGRALFGDDMTERDVAKFALEEARALLVAGRKAKAAKAGHRALELIEWIDPQDRGRAYVALGDIFLETNDVDRARMVYEAGFELLLEHGKPYLITGARRYADLLEAEGDAAGALEVLKRATAASVPIRARS